MAVTRIKATAKWHLAAAALVKDQKRLARELGRAAERPGLLAELHGDEARLLAERMPDDQLVQEALARLLDCEERERTRPRARDIALGLAKRDRSYT